MSSGELANAFKTAARHRKVEIGPSISEAFPSFPNQLGSCQGHFKVVQVRVRIKGMLFFIGFIMFLHLGMSFKGCGSYHQGHLRVISGASVRS